MSKTISIIIPTYNERDNIITLVKRIHGALSSYSYEIVFVDDNSSDGTAELASALSTEYPVRVIVRQNERGLASAVVHGLKHVEGQIVAVMDADLQHPPEVIPALLREIESGADIVVASRYVKEGACQDWGLIRRIMSKGGVFLAHLLLPSTRQINDPMSGFFMLNKQVVASVDLKPTGYKILLEILVVGQFRKVAEVPYTFGTRTSGESKLSARQQKDYLKHIYSLMKRKGELLRFAKFCLVGLSGVLVNTGLLWLLTEFAGFFYLLSAAIGIESSIISNFALNDFFTFHDRRSPGMKLFLGRLIKFNMVSLAGVAINMAILWLLTENLEVYYLLSNLCGIAAATLWNYFVNTWWTWK
ncbi:MAG: dolichol monophosphate mannose synthase [Chloroflexi bacterium CG_4_9_14_3_um_filter_45_9]|nr:MAG: dolichol monophosphate mannose synthase [Chloroflexi bacterium CG08_land_8_20_14_0_20_45_12]PIX27021.1 MAG: dolichol monophosphate mannose synthase [Chloroflexi bacterium CG_4_8_14_3_um_filter_45_15]PJB50244.1 MAG: dolichol monophosphate mannose synthase [Chloroflexi bacterium CG_4_9_14_3_um_filter_45_9]